VHFETATAHTASWKITALGKIKDFEKLFVIIKNN